MAFDFDFKSANAKNRDGNHIFVELVLLFHGSMENFRCHDSFLNIRDKLNRCMD